MLCTQEGCQEPAVASDRCGPHHALLAGRATCDVADCTRKVYAKGHCARHDKQLLRNGRVLEDRADRSCAVETCEWPSASRGWCHAHHLRWSRTGDVQADVPVGRSGATCCSILGCARPPHASGLCQPHYRRLLMTGAPRPDEPVREIPGDGFTSRGYRIVPVAFDERWLTLGQTPVAERRLVMSRHLQRPLTPDESVHHRNGDRSDNALENLELWSRFQPNGQRVVDKVRWARELLRRYGEEFPETS